MFSRFSNLFIVELEGVCAKKWDVVFMGDLGEFLTYV